MIRLLFLIATLALFPSVAPAHHGWSGYDESKPLTLSGTIRESGYEHPHGFVRLQAADRTWLVVLAPPSRMERRGLKPGALAAGTTATVKGYAHRETAGELRAENITIGGLTVELR